MSFEHILFENAGRHCAADAQPARAAEQLQHRHARGSCAGAGEPRRLRRARAGADRCRARLLCRPGPRRPCGGTGGRTAGSRAIDREVLQAAGAGAAPPAAAGHRCRERRGRRSRRQHRARLRSGDCRTLGELRAGLRQAGTDPRLGRHLVPAAPGRPGARHRTFVPGREAPRRAGRGLGPHLALRGRYGARADRGRPGAAASPPRPLWGWRAPSRRSTKGSAAPSSSSSTSSATCQGELGRSADYAEGVAAFAAKRTPQFTGR